MQMSSDDGSMTMSGLRCAPPLGNVSGENLGHRLLIDIGALQEITGRDGELSTLLVFPAPPARLAALRAALPPELKYVASDQAWAKADKALYHAKENDRNQVISYESVFAGADKTGASGE